MIEQWEPHYRSQKMDHRRAFDDLPRTVKAMMNKSGKPSDSELSQGPVPQNIPRGPITVPAIDLTPFLKRMESEYMVSPYGEEFLVLMTELTSAVCFQSLESEMIIEGQPGTTVDDFHDKLRKVVHDTFVATSRAGDRESTC